MGKSRRPSLATAVVLLTVEMPLVRVMTETLTTFAAAFAAVMMLVLAHVVLLLSFVAIAAPDLVVADLPPRS